MGTGTRRAAGMAGALLVVGLPLVGIGAAPAGAATLTVTTTADVVDAGDGLTSLREAVGAANASPGADTVVLADGATYTLSLCDAGSPEDDANATGDLDVTDELTITLAGGPGGTPATVEQTCGTSAPARIVESAAPLTLEGLVLLGGRTPGTDNGGAAVLARSSAATALTMTSVVVDGAVGVPGSADPFSNAAVEVPAGGAALDDVAITGTVDATGLSVHGPSTVSGSDISGNAVDDGYAAGIVAVGALTVSDSTVSDNTCAGCLAGGIYGFASAVTMSDSVVSGNVGEHTGGATGWPLVATDSTFSDNESAGAFGGAITGSVDLERVVVEGNTSGFLGGGITVNTGLAVDGTGFVPFTSTVTDSTVTGNAAMGGGGIAVLRDGDEPVEVVVTRSTITGNAAQSGGGVLVGASFGEAPEAEVRIEQSTVADNVASGASLADDLVVGVGGVANLAAAAVGSAQEAGPDCVVEGTGVLSSEGGNVASDGTCGVGAGPDDVASAGDLLLGPLGDHGGATPTRVPEAGSPVRDVIPAGSPRCAGVDQRGVARPQGPACDAGAVEVIPAPTVTAMAPKVGPTTGGTVVTLSGSGFTGATAVRFGPTPAASFTVVDDATITAVAPARPVGLVNVFVEGPGGASTSGAPSWFGFQVPPTAAPTVSAVAPNIGPVEGGTSVTIRGTGFLTASSVRFGPTAEASFTVVNDTTIVAVAPPRAASLVNVWVTNPHGTNPNQASSWYSYRVITGPAPTVTSVAPNQGPAAGGTVVTITGSGFADVEQVRFGPTPAASFTIVDDTTITAVAPARPVGLVNVFVTSQNGTNPNQPSSWYRFT